MYIPSKISDEMAVTTTTVLFYLFHSTLFFHDVVNLVNGFTVPVPFAVDYAPSDSFILLHSIHQSNFKSNRRRSLDLSAKKKEDSSDGTANVKGDKRGPVKDTLSQKPLTKDGADFDLDFKIDAYRDYI